MLKEERFGQILEVLSKDGKVQFDTLATALKVSEDTVRRDIEALHNNVFMISQNWRQSNVIGDNSKLKMNRDS